MQIDRERLLNDLTKARSSMVHASSRDDVVFNYEGFDILNKVYGSLTGLQYDTSKIFLANDYYNKLLDKMYLKSMLYFYNYAHHNSEEIKTIFKNYDDYMTEIGFIIYPFYNEMKKYNEKTFIDIILSYYSLYGNKIYNAVKKYFDENRIEMSYVKTMDSDLAAAFANLTLFNTGYIVSIHNNYNTWAMVDLVHELGHAVDAELFLFPQSKKMSVFSDVFCEVPSTTFEMGFLDYLLENNIDENARIIKNYKHSLLADASDELNYLYTLENIDTDFEGNMYDDQGMVYPFREMIIYGLGYYFSFNMVALRKEMGEKEFNKMFYNFISSRKENMDLINLVDIMGVDRNSFLNGDLIKNDINDNQNMLKLKYSYFGDLYE